ncbi:HutD family protein [Trinickia sp. Y13]|uniref:HutD/Ves family protein n=1 Tax=Trinickia sp. Y13 TaxID=2917807 RepID=UPI002406501F|nr:HutD family protein [Trinickia sp. Y13]MDG0024359.1 HutD family protein [Trinickia sp. Y13]
MSAIEIRSLSSVPVEPWRNGGGVTQTLAASGNAWRVSVAQVERDGPYSRFDGVARISFVLGGNGVMLVDGASIVRLLPFTAVEYDGGAAWNASLVDGPVTALNVMTETGRCRAKVAAVVDTLSVSPGCTAIVIALDSECSYRGAWDTKAFGTLAPGQFMVACEVDRALLLAPATYAPAARQWARPPVLVTIEPATAPGAID